MYNVVRWYILIESHNVVCYYSRTCLAWKGFTETNRRRYTGQQPRTKSARGPADKPRMNRGSTAGFVPPSVYMGFCLFVLAKIRSGQLSSIPWRARGTVGFWATRPVGVLFCPAPPRPAAPPCAAPTRIARGMFGFWIRQVYHGMVGTCCFAGTRAWIFSSSRWTGGTKSTGAEVQTSLYPLGSALCMRRIWFCRQGKT